MDLICLVLFGIFLLIVGYLLPFLRNKVTARALAWFIALATTFFSVAVSSEEPALYRMIAIVSLQLLSMKIIVLTETYSKGNNLTFIQWCAFASWFGMRPLLFEKLPSRSLSFLPLFWKGISRIAIGVLVLYLSKKAETFPLKIFFVPELLLLIGLSLILHFGILNIAAALWRSLGVDAKELFRAPYKSRSLKEFWGKRWNIAFSEMTALVAYRPLKEKTGPAIAMTASFILSGALHEIAISFPVNAGYGLPLLYFVIHGLVMYAEGKLTIVKKIIQHQVFSHVWVLGWLVLPMPLLFHITFIEHVLKPLRSGILNSLSTLVH